MSARYGVIHSLAWFNYRRLGHNIRNGKGGANTQEAPLAIVTIGFIAALEAIMVLTYKPSYSGDRKRDQIGKAA
ncbi:MAG: hypothetical protein LBF86_07595 [Helicobacteraceae bacterium]|nr:hypothetical protein [Helicobacteraceae bacterium]